MDLFSQLETVSPISKPLETNEPKGLKHELTVKELSNSAIITLRNQGKHITQTKEGYLIKY